MTDTGYERACPRCSGRFTARTECGICPSCGLFSRVDRSGAPIGLARTYDGVELEDWPYEEVDEAFALVLQDLADGGGPLYTAERCDGYPSLAVVHEQLTARFDELRRSVERFVPSESLTSPAEAEIAAYCAEYHRAERLQAITWRDAGRRCDLVCRLTADGGSVDLVVDGNAFWFS
jgi:hypothetical protein